MAREDPIRNIVLKRNAQSGLMIPLRIGPNENHLL